MWPSDNTSTDKDQEEEEEDVEQERQKRRRSVSFLLVFFYPVITYQTVGRPKKYLARTLFYGFSSPRDLVRKEKTVYKKSKFNPYQGMYFSKNLGL